MRAGIGSVPPGGMLGNTGERKFPPNDLRDVLVIAAHWFIQLGPVEILYHDFFQSVMFLFLKYKSFVCLNEFVSI